MIPSFLQNKMRDPPECAIETTNEMDHRCAYDPIWLRQDYSKRRFKKHGEKAMVFYTMIAWWAKSWEWCPNCQNRKVVCKMHQQALSLTEWSECTCGPSPTLLPRESHEDGRLTQ